MNLNLNLTPETEIKLRAFVAATGKPPEQVALEALSDKLSGEQIESTSISTDEWLQEFDAWMSSLVSRNPQVDDTRDSFYPDQS